jgi:hypothetical protein
MLGWDDKFSDYFKDRVQIGRKRDEKAFWPCNMVVLVTPKRGLSMEEPDLE